MASVCSMSFLLAPKRHPTWSALLPRPLRWYRRFWIVTSLWSCSHVRSWGHIGNSSSPLNQPRPPPVSLSQVEVPALVDRCLLSPAHLVSQVRHGQVLPLNKYRQAFPVPKVKEVHGVLQTNRHLHGRLKALHKDHQVSHPLPSILRTSSPELRASRKSRTCLHHSAVLRKLVTIGVCSKGKWLDTSPCLPW